MDSGICPGKQERLIKIEAKVYTDATLALEFVEAEIKLLEFDTISK
jgi:hypothetical protein